MPAKFNLQTATPRDQLLALGKQLKQYRKANKLSAEAVATAAGLSRTTLHRIVERAIKVNQGRRNVLKSGAGLAALSIFGLNACG